MRNTIFGLVIVWFCLVPESHAQISLETYVAGISQPTDIASAHDGSKRLFIVERNGRIRLVNAQGTLVNDPFLDITAKVDDSGGEEGLLGLVFHPDYQANGYFFVYYIQTKDGVRQGVLERYSVSINPDQGNEDSAAEVLRIDQPQENHNGGDLAFGPQGNLYLGTGDGGSGNDPGERSQNLTLPLGKLLRINVDQLPYGVPDDNPFAKASGDTIREIWAWGLRNPWRFSFDDKFGLWIGDVGQSAREEINYIPAAKNIGGINYGWDCREGDIACPACGNDHCSGINFQDPVYTYGPGPGLSVTGGYVLDGDYYHEFKGYYIFADFAKNEIKTLEIQDDKSVVVSEPIPANKISTFGKDDDGQVYAASYSGVIYKVVENNRQQVPLTPMHIQKFEKSVLISWQTSFELNVSHFEIERSFADQPFKQIGVVPVKNEQGNSVEYEYEDFNVLPGPYLYRLKSRTLDGTFSYSPTIGIEIDHDVQLDLIPNPASDKINVFYSRPKFSGKIQIVGLDGGIIKNITLENTAQNTIEIDVSELPRGLFLLQYLDDSQQKIAKKLILY